MANTNTPQDITLNNVIKGLISYINSDNTDSDKKEISINIKDATADLVKALCNIFGTDYNKLLNESYNDILDNLTKKLIAEGKNSEVKKAKDATYEDIVKGTALFEPFEMGKKDINEKNINNMKVEDVSINKSTISHDLLLEYNNKLEKEEQEKKEKLYKEIPVNITNTVIDILNDKETHNYKFIKGDNGINPAVEVIIKNEYNISDSNILTEICIKLKELCGFELVTISLDNDKNNMIFYLVLS